MTMMKKYEGCILLENLDDWLGGPQSFDFIQLAGKIRASSNELRKICDCKIVDLLEVKAILCVAPPFRDCNKFILMDFDAILFWRKQSSGIGIRY